MSAESKCWPSQNVSQVEMLAESKYKYIEGLLQSRLTYSSHTKLHSETRELSPFDVSKEIFSQSSEQ